MAMQFNNLLKSDKGIRYQVQYTDYGGNLESMTAKQGTIADLINDELRQKNILETFYHLGHMNHSLGAAGLSPVAWQVPNPKRVNQKDWYLPIHQKRFEEVLPNGKFVLVDHYTVYFKEAVKEPVNAVSTDHYDAMLDLYVLGNDRDLPEVGVAHGC